MDFTERFLYHIWDAQHLKTRLKTKSGKKLNILFQGRWNTNSGPDFNAAIIKIDKKVKQGDIEIDMSGNDWKNHGHQENPEFNNVILQVVYENKSDTQLRITENGRLIEVFELIHYLDINISKLIKKYSGLQFKPQGKSCLFFSELEIEKLAYILANLGHHRLQQKIKRFSAELFFSDLNEIFYQGIMESLGYSKNKFQMLLVAKKLTYKKLREFRNKGMRKLEMISLLLGSTGLFKKLPSTFPQDLIHKLGSLYQTQIYQKQNFDINWNLFRIRPNNNPAIRILQISGFLYNSLSDSIIANLIPLFSFPESEFDLKKFQHNLFKFFRSDNIGLPDNCKLGKSRIDTILVNTIIPLMIIYARQKKYQGLEKIILEIYKRFRRLPDNQITNYLKSYLNPEQSRLASKNTIHQQGIIQLYQSYCRFHNCELCLENRNKLLNSQ